MAIILMDRAGNEINCVDCSGIMELSDPPFSGDFNEEGQQEAFCNNYGHGFKHKNDEMVAKCQSTYIGSISDNRLLDIDQSICTEYHLPYLKKWQDKQDFLVLIRSTCFSRSDLINYYISNIPSNFIVNVDYLEKIICPF